MYDASGTVFGFFSLSGRGDFEIVGSKQNLEAEAVLKVINDTYFIEDIASTFSGGLVKARFTDNTTVGKGKNSKTASVPVFPNLSVVVVNTKFMLGMFAVTDFTGLFSEMLAAMGNQVFNNRLKPVITAAMNEFTKVNKYININFTIYLQCYSESCITQQTMFRIG